MCFNRENEFNQCNQKEFEVADLQIPNYPDVLGYVTNVERYNVGFVQVVLAARPPAVPAGRPLEIIFLLQNTADTHVDVSIDLQLPPKDGAGQKGTFTTSKDKLVVGLEPAEVGYATLPIISRPGTAPASDYMVVVDIAEKPVDKRARRIRDPLGQGRFNLARIPKKSRQRLEGLKKLAFSAETRGGFMKSTCLQLSFGIVKGKAGKAVPTKHGWVSLWTLDHQSDSEPLIDKFGEMLRLRIFPGLKRQHLYPPLYAKTVEVFEAGGYPLTEVEASAATRLITLILEFANSGDLVSQGGQAAGPFYVQPILTTKRLPGEDHERPLPKWTISFLQAMAKDDRFTKVPPSRTVPAIAYDNLLYDAMIYAFHIIERESGEELGTPEEMAAYANHILQKLAKQEPVSFADVYLPLVLGGIIITDLMLLKDERLTDVMRTMVHMVEDRRDEEGDDNAFIFDLAQRLLEQKLRQYGTLDGGR